ncbi:MAG: hypothetical protein AAGD43_21420 [Pseudomonadota bacterium]
MLFDYLKTPTGYKKDWKRYALNQIGHFVLPIFALWLGVPLFFVIAMMIVIEVIQLLLFDGEAWDCVEDFAFEMMGVLAFLVSPWFTLGTALYLLAGALRRYSEAGCLEVSR